MLSCRKGSISDPLFSLSQPLRLAQDQLLELRVQSQEAAVGLPTIHSLHLFPHPVASY